MGLVFLIVVRLNLGSWFQPVGSELGVGPISEGSLVSQILFSAQLSWRA